MRLSKAVRSALHAAIKSAFPDRDRLTLFIELELGDTAASILVSRATIDMDVLDLLNWAESEGRVGDLVREARAAKPSNQALMRAERLVFSELTEGDDDARRAAEAFGLAPARAELEAILDVAVRFADPESWRKTMLERERAVCRIDRGTQGYGTGFLVAPNMVLTCAHVVKHALADGGDATTLSARFDHQILSDGAMVALGRCAPVAQEVRRNDAVDYALLRLAEPMAGRVPIPLVGRDVATGQPLLILQHPDAKPMKLGQGPCDGPDGTDATLLKYRVNTEPGSSGSPVFNASWDLVALHRQGGRDTNAGRTSAAVAAGLRDILEVRGAVDAIREVPRPPE